mmetsp:Transcript_70532/g.168955  ORF Transcript_70532/g.168955 Transcript_70532/m.168955 type:complete len:86 (+) Transcript_70532:804-1061(+)
MAPLLTSLDVQPMTGDVRPLAVMIGVLGVAARKFPGKHCAQAMFHMSFFGGVIRRSHETQSQAPPIKNGKIFSTKAFRTFAQCQS